MYYRLTIKDNAGTFTSAFINIAFELYTEVNALAATKGTPWLALAAIDMPETIFNARKATKSRQWLEILERL